jgi:hypothetical protein
MRTLISCIDLNRHMTICRQFSMMAAPFGEFFTLAKARFYERMSEAVVLPGGVVGDGARRWMFEDVTPRGGVAATVVNVQRL